MSRKIFTLCLTLLAVSAVSQEPAEAETVNSAIGATEELGAEALEAEASTIELANVETAVAQTEPEIRYVSDEFFVPLRETPCPRCKIVHWGIKSGTKVDLFEVKDGWGLVATKKGYKGWMEEQFISSTPAGRQLLAQANQEKADVADRVAQLMEHIKNLEQQSEEWQQKIDAIEGDNQNLRSQISEVKGISSGPIALNKQNQILVKQNHMLRTDNDVLQAEVEVLSNDHRNQSFIYGGITVFLGALLAILIPRLRGRKRLSEWG
ncbi:MAG: TIGR04211 family SH3 domain-containing protein [Porticoccaceae bacterium]|nr:TIGR04211 family SH3 domain-containing protein [Porticoccaceae bacterium]MBT4590990.1 TIGR04211 family SH3 domain-containing protein [Porticoccaceae bacterium]MBT7168098.1 TIGR04211 family SH3 domain-containing protein [Porticoccaceae bacterium]MBT7566169.1 TIGR04211 family SH3 domain-containing protein [Porticoccaceae bacterium]MBT7964491.1 TIGR04211 family SH3 domain-containing protein [Porticoccaceae bacterium]